MRRTGETHEINHNGDKRGRATTRQLKIQQKPTERICRGTAIPETILETEHHFM